VSTEPGFAKFTVPGPENRLQATEIWLGGSGSPSSVARPVRLAD
jgi:hypothetical protein